MTTLTTTKAKLLFVEVPDDARNIRIDGRYIYFQVEPKGDDEGLSEFYPECCPLPSGSNYTFLFTTKQATEEDWKGVVDEAYRYTTTYYNEPDDMTNVEVIHHEKPVMGSKTTWKRTNRITWVGYVNDPELAEDELDTATESGLSLQKANGMDVNKNYAVIECKP